MIPDFKVRFNFLLTILAIFFIFSVHADDSAKGKLHFLESIISLDAAFKQTVYDVDGTELERSSGHFLLQRPGKFRWEYVKPYRQTIVADGNKIWLFDNELEQITVKSQSDALIGTPALLLSGERSLHDDFAVEKVSTAGKDTTLVLRTKRTDVNFSTIKMVFRDILLHQMEFVDGLGQTTRLDFSDLKHNKSILPSAFVLAIPEGVDVIGAD